VTAGIILAAGASSRMGTPKALLNYRGETFLHRLIRILRPICNPVIVVIRDVGCASWPAPGLPIGAEAVVGRAPWPAADPPVGLEANFVINPDPDRGQLSSLQTGLATLPATADGFLFTPVDSPAVEPATVALLSHAFATRDPGTLLVVPRHAGRKGHPVFCARELAAEFLALDAATGQAREVVRRHVDSTLFVDVDDSGVLIDVDDPAAYRELTRSTP
jgi:CTP:molybdopterin cytidylyltransferase MocA